jgi:hypothetical protein
MLSAVEKSRFLIYELGLLSRQAAFATRGKSCPIYANSRTTKDKERAAREIQMILDAVWPKYSAGHVSEVMHIEFILQTANDLSISIGTCLHGKRFRIGISQKLINLYLKYLWTAGLAPEPLHCPIDGRIRDAADIEYDWRTNDSIEDYQGAISLLKQRAGKLTLAVWELTTFRRARDR